MQQRNIVAKQVLRESFWQICIESLSCPQISRLRFYVSQKQQFKAEKIPKFPIKIMEILLNSFHFNVHTSV